MSDEPMSTGWPRLTEELAPSEWGRCESCLVEGEIGDELVRWREHDDRDRPEPRAVVLCQECSEEIIEPHPRLYAKLQTYAPMPGSMELCQDCVHREGYRCGHPDLTINGGEGLATTFPKPSVALVTKLGKRAGRRCVHRKWYHGPATDCAGRKERPNL